MQSHPYESEKMREIPLTFMPFLLIISIASFFWASVSVANVEDIITRGEFIHMMARHNPDNSLLPKDHAKLTKKDLYEKTRQALSGRGYKVLEGKNIDQPLSTLEFVRVTYAFTGGPAGKSLFDQKLYLKQSGIVESADIGLATAVEGTVFQFHKGEVTGNLVNLAAPIFTQDRINTGSKAKSSFTFDDGSILTLSENSIVHISKHIYDPDKGFRETIVNVSVGVAKFVVTKTLGKGSSFKVVTPVVTTSVRGTEFVVIVDPTGKTQVITLDGSVQTIPRGPDGEEGKPSNVSKGESQSISAKGEPGAVEPVNPNQLEDINDKTEQSQQIVVNKGVSRSEAKDAAMATIGAAKKVQEKKEIPQSEAKPDPERLGDEEPKDQDKKPKKQKVKNVS